MAFTFYQFSLVDDLPSMLKIEEEEITVMELLEYLEKEYHSVIKKKSVTENGELDPDVVASVNGTHVRHLDGLKTMIKRDNEVAFSIMLAGG